MSPNPSGGNIIIENLPLMSSKQPNKLSDLDKSNTKHGGVLIEHICEKNLISNETDEIINFTFFIVSLLKLYVVIT